MFLKNLSCNEAAADIFNSISFPDDFEDDASLDAPEDELEDDELPLLLHPTAPNIKHNASDKTPNFFFIIEISPYLIIVHHN